MEPAANQQIVPTDHQWQKKEDEFERIEQHKFVLVSPLSDNLTRPNLSSRKLMKRFAIFIPAFNVETTIVSVLQRLPQDMVDSAAEIFVVDNHSTDETVTRVLRYKESQDLQKLNVIRNPRNCGYGGSQKVAYRHALNQGYDVVAMVHGDGQYAPEVLPVLVAPVLAGEADMLFGSRMTGDPLAGGMPRYRYVCNKGLTWIQNFILGTSLSEFHSGYRVYSGEALKKIAFEACADNYDFDADIIIMLVRARQRIAERTIPTHYGPESKSVSFFHCIVYGLNILRGLLKFLLVKWGVLADKERPDSHRR